MGRPARLTLSAVGDSVTNEYHKRQDTADNWVEQAVWHRGIFFPHGGVWFGHDNRHKAVQPATSGHEYNFGVGGVLSKDILRPGDQIECLSHTIPSSIAVLEIGVADLFGLYAVISNDPNPLANQDYQATAQNINDAIQRLQGAGTQVIVANVPYPGITPDIIAHYPDPNIRARVTTVIQQANATIRQFARQHGVPVLDFFSVANCLATPPGISIGHFQLDPRTFTPAQDPSDPHNLFCDSQHPGTIMSGLFANMVFEAIRQAGWGVVRPFTGRDLLRNAGLEPSTDWDFDVSRFVL